MIELYTDGACRGNPGPGSYAFIAFKNKKIIFKDGGFKEKTTNNEMELTAILEGLKKCNFKDSILLFSDSNYAVQGINHWRFNWKKNNWLKSDKKPVLNKKIWQELDELIDQFQDLKIKWIKGHHESLENNLVDELANKILDKKYLL